MKTYLIRPGVAEVAAALGAVRFLIGVDGGGTGTRVRLARLDGKPAEGHPFRLIGQGAAGPSALGQGVEQAWRHIGQALAAAAADAGIEVPPASECAIGLGLSGVGVTHQAQAFLDAHPGFALLALDGDGWTTVLGAHGGRPGAVVAAGTGSIGEVLRGDGSRTMVGGWGWTCGDEGSGAWLGLKAVSHVQNVLDGRASGGPLADAIVARTGRDRAALLHWISQAGQQGFAGLAPLVFEHEGKDAFAAALVAEAVVALEKIADALDPQHELPLALCGSIALRLGERFPAVLRARCVAPQGDSAAGALILVRNELEKLR
ncbi:MAG: ATPase [Paucibacter sp.]|nr:ATPase [Roseateles sp.]